MNVQRHAYRFRYLNSANQRFYRMTAVERHAVHDHRRRRWLHPQRADGHRVQHRRHRARRHDHRLLEHPGGHEDRPAERRAAAAADRRGPRIPTRTARSCSSRSWPARRSRARALPGTLNTIATLTPDRPTRFLVQNVQSDDAGRLLQAELDGQLFHTQTTELPTIGSTEDWAFINTTPLTHNKHVHLIEFLVVKRQAFDAARYLADWKRANGNPPFTHPTLRIDPAAYLTGPVLAAGARGEWLEGHRAHAGRRGHLDPDPLVAAAERDRHQHAGREPVPVRSGVRHRVRLALPPGGARGQRDDAADDGHPDVGRGRRYAVGFRASPGVARGLVDFNGVDYSALRRPHLGGGPDAEHASRICGSASTTATAIGPFRSSTTWATGSSSGATSTRPCSRTWRRTRTARTSRRRCGSWCSSRDVMS